MNENIFVALAAAVVCLVVGLGFLLIVMFRFPAWFTTLHFIGWLLIALVPVFPLFAIFPDSTFSIKTKVISGGSAAGLFVFIWLTGMKRMREAYDVDQLKATIEGLKSRIKELEEQLRKPEPAEHEPLMYSLRNGKKVGLIGGDITDVTIADIWVSSENTNMEMARFFDRSVSAAIRYFGSKRDDGGRVIVKRDEAGKITFDGDLIAEDWKKKKGPEFYVDAASVFVTTPGELLNSNNVKSIFHVAAVHGTPRDGYKPVPNLGDCVKNIFKKAESFTHKSIVLPLLATGTAKGEVKSISRQLIRTAVTELEGNDNHVLDTVYFLAWSDKDRDICKKVFAELNDRITQC